MSTDEHAPAEELPGPTEWGEHPHGVGPWIDEYGTEPPTDPRYDPELLAHGDRRNVVDRYRYWALDAIVADLDTRRHPFHVAVENWRHDRNIGAVVRNANAFLAEYLPGHNRRFATPTPDVPRAWRPAPRDLARILSCRYTRVVSRDNTVTLGDRVLALPARGRGRREGW